MQKLIKVNKINIPTPVLLIFLWVRNKKTWFMRIKILWELIKTDWFIGLDTILANKWKFVYVFCRWSQHSRWCILWFPKISVWSFNTFMLWRVTIKWWFIDIVGKMHITAELGHCCLCVWSCMFTLQGLCGWNNTHFSSYL